MTSQARLVRTDESVERARLAASSRLLAPRLLGAVLRSSVGGDEVAVRLTEVEAYEGTDDSASHAYRGPTGRTAVMFGPAGHLYCYFTSGMHWCANIVCGPDGQASAVLLRAGEVIRGLDVATARRPAARSSAELARGPARLASCLGLGREQNGIDLCAPDAVVALESIPARRLAAVVAGPRVGISSAQDRQWRFWLPDEPSVSAFRTGGRRRPVAARQTERRD
jgi:DNA-3-methyladenine glycosylase